MSSLEVRTAKLRFTRANIKYLEATMIDSDVGYFKMELYEFAVSQYGLLTCGHTSSDWLEIFRYGKNVFSDGFGFFIEDVRPTDIGGAIITGRSYEVLLDDETVPRFGSNGGDVLTIVKAVLDSSSKVVYRDANFDDPSDTYSKTFDGDRILEILKEVTSLTDQWFYVNRLGNDFHVFMKNERGRGSAYNPVRTLTREHGIGSNAGYSHPRKIINRIRIVGRRASLIDAFHNDTASQTKYGVFESDPIYDDRITTTTEAANRATQIFAVFADPNDDADVSTSTFIDDFYIGDYVRLKNIRSALDSIRQPVKITVIFSEGKRDAVDAEFEFPMERSEKLFKSNQRGAWRAGTFLGTDIKTSDMGTYFIDTGYIDVDNIGGTGTQGGCDYNCYISVTIPSGFTTTSVKGRIVGHDLVDIGLASCYIVWCVDDNTTIKSGNWPTTEEGEVKTNTGTDTADHGGHVIRAGNNYPTLSSFNLRLLVGWET